MNKKNRMYYDCPIEALYMAKNFGVEFEDDCGTDITIDILIGEIENRTLYGLVEEEKIYITKESEHIFEPRDGDIDFDGRLVVSVEEMTRLRGVLSMLTVDMQYVSTEEANGIDKRNGKQFFIHQTEDLMEEGL